jgi:hypothetical protein
MIQARPLAGPARPRENQNRTGYRLYGLQFAEVRHFGWPVLDTPITPQEAGHSQDTDETRAC